MKNTILYLSSCDTCAKILKEIDIKKHGFLLQDIKTSPITEMQLNLLKAKTGSYESLFSKRAMLYKSLDLAKKDLNEEDYKTYILDHYTFLKRPVIVYNDSIFVGSDKSVIAALHNALK